MIFFQTGMSENGTDHSYINDEKLGQSCTFSLKRGGGGLFLYLAVFFETHIRTMSYIGSYPPPPRLLGS